MFNVIREDKTPASLKKMTAYDGKDVYEALTRSFFNKCYLCETKEPHDINIEHFEPHLGDPEKKYNWQNLYYCCGRCNNIKLAGHIDLLDCCDQGTNVFRAIKHLPPFTPYSKSVCVVAMDNSTKTTNTVDLLDKIFNSDHTVNKTISGSYLRRKVFDSYNLLLKQIENYYSPIATEVEKLDSIERMKVLICRKSPYSAFLRWCILEDQQLAPLLDPFMD